MIHTETTHPYVAFLWEIVTLEFMIKFFIFYFFIVWISLIIWVSRDISERTQNMFLRVFSLLIIILLTPAGIFLYLLIRPRKNIAQKLSKEIEENLSILGEIVSERIGHNAINDIICPSCLQQVEEDFTICPNCITTLKHSCKKCHKEIRESWDVCPYCQTKQKQKKKHKKEKKTD